MLTKFKASLFVKILIVFFCVLALLVTATFLILPGQLKKYIEKNDTSWINREISIQKIAFNPLTFTLSINGLDIKEPKSTTSFASLDKLIINLDALPLFKTKINADEISLHNLEGTIIQNGTQFNFSDLLSSEEKAKEDATDATSSIEFNLQNINIVNAKLNYIDKQIGSEIVLDSITIKDKRFTSKDSIIDMSIALHQPNAGWVNGTVSYNLTNSNYNVASKIESWQLAPFKKYVTSVIHLNEFNGVVNATIDFSGNVDKNYIKTKGQITLADFKLIDPESKPLVNVGKLFVDVKEIDTKANIYDFQDILVDNTKITFEYLPNGDNFTKWLVDSEESEVLIAEENENSSNYYVSPFEMLSIYIYDMTKEYIFKSYTAKNIQFTNFNLRFYDYTLEDLFHMDLEQVSIKAQNIKPENEYANFTVNGKMNSTAIVDGDISVSRQGVENMDIDMSVKGLFLNRFSPYGREYTAHRFTEGISSFSNKSVIKDSYLKSTNSLHIENIKLSKKDKTRTGSSLPMRLAVSLMKDNKGNIDLDIPIEGPINDPKYKFGKVIWQVVKNLFTKIVTSPVKSLSKIFKIDEKDLKNIYFDNGQLGLSPHQKKPLNTIVKVLNKKDDLVINLTYLYNKDYELDAIALKSAKLSYLKQSNLKLDTSIPIGKHAFDLSNTDPEFLEYLKNITPNFDETISIPENARRLVGNDKIQQDLEDVIVKQKELVKNYLVVEKGIPENRFRIIDGANSEEALNQTQPKFEVKFDVVE